METTIRYGHFKGCSANKRSSLEYLPFADSRWRFRRASRTWKYRPRTGRFIRMANIGQTPRAGEGAGSPPISPGLAQVHPECSTRKLPRVSTLPLRYPAAASLPLSLSLSAVFVGLTSSLYLPGYLAALEGRSANRGGWTGWPSLQQEHERKRLEPRGTWEDGEG